MKLGAKQRLQSLNKNHPCADIDLAITTTVTPQPLAAVSYTVELSIRCSGTAPFTTSFTTTGLISLSQLVTLLSAFTNLVTGDGHLCVTIAGLPQLENAGGDVSVTISTS